MADSPFVFDGAAPWNPERALDAAARSGVEDQIAVTRRELEVALEPAPRIWFGKRLPVLWTLFMAAREADPRALTVWMSETAHLLADLPHDIVAYSIDEAIRTSHHNFMPSIGVIRGIAVPLVTERHEHIKRLSAMEAALADPAAVSARQDRRLAQSRIARMEAPRS